MKDYAVLKNWKKGTIPNWKNGIKQTFDGKEQMHSAFLTLSPNKDELNRRRWYGQVTDLFPYIEKSRIKIIKSIRAHLTVPYTDKYGETINNIYEM